MNKYTLMDIAELIGANLDDVGADQVTGIASLESARPTQLAYAQSHKQLDQVRHCHAAAVIVDSAFPAVAETVLLRAPDAKVAFIRALELFAPEYDATGVHPSAVVDPDVQIGVDVVIEALAVVEAGSRLGAGARIRAGSYIGRNVHIGAGCDIGPNTVLLDETIVGERCRLYPGVVLGADGYGYHWMEDHHHKIPQLGRVVVEDDVEIGANTCIDRATLGETRIGRGSKLDNLVQVGHNTELGKHVILVSQVGIAGSCDLEDGVIAGGQVGIADHVRIGAGAQIGAGSGVMNNIDPGEKVWGVPTRPIGQAMREQAALGKLPELLRGFRRQQKELAELRERLQQLEQESKN